MIIILNKFPTHIAKTDNKIASNKMIKINNQAIYNGALNRFARNIVMKNLHDYISKNLLLYKHLYKRESHSFPMNIKVIIYTVINHGNISMRSGKLIWKLPEEDYKPNWDIENLASIWIKAINDSLTLTGFIPDDNISYINSISYEYIEVKDFEDRKIEIHLDE